MTDDLETRVAELELAVLALSGARELEFGDLPGHPFHGNQWTGDGARADAAVAAAPEGKKLSTLKDQVTAHLDRAGYIKNPDGAPTVSVQKVLAGGHPDHGWLNVGARANAKFRQDTADAVAQDLRAAGFNVNGVTETGQVQVGLPT